MKFETPIAEVELFELKDIISASTTDTGADTEAPSETTDDTTDADMMFSGNCIYHDARDDDNWEDCL